MLACVRGGRAAKGHKTYPLRGRHVTRPNQVWGETRFRHWSEDKGRTTSPTCPLSADCFAIACRAMDAAWVPVSGRDPGLAHPQGAGLADIQHARSRRLRRRAERGTRPVRSARDHAHRSGRAVHVLRLDRPVAPIRRPHLEASRDIGFAHALPGKPDQRRRPALAGGSTSRTASAPTPP